MVDRPQVASDDREERLNEAVVEYLASRAAGKAPKPESFVNRYPDLRDELASFLKAQRVIDAAQGKNSTPIPPIDAGLVLPGVAAKIVAGHEILGELDRGGFGVIYKARHQVLRELRAIKRPKAREDTIRTKMLARFQREVQAIGSLRDDHVVRPHDAGQDDEGPYLVMEYLDGEPLSRLMKRTGPLPVNEACALARHAALGLQAAHEKGLIHRDVKPSNLVLARAGAGKARVVVIDWGLVLRAGADDEVVEQVTETLMGMGTADFIAPEQIHDAHNVDCRADIYSLGATLYCLLAGRPPFDGASKGEKLRGHQLLPFPALSGFRGDVHKDVIAAINKMVEKEPAQRFATPLEAAVALQAFCCADCQLAPLLAGGQLPETTLAPSVPHRTNRLSTAIFVGLLFAVALLAMGFGYWLSGRPGMLKVSNFPMTMTALAGHEECALGLSFTGGGKNAVSSDGVEIICWDLERQQPHQRWRHGAAAMPTTPLLITPDDKQVVVGLQQERNRGRLQKYELSTGAPRGTEDVLQTEFACLALSPDGQWLAEADTGGRLRIRDFASWTIKTDVNLGVTSTCMAFTPDGRQVWCGGADGKLRCCAADGKVIKTQQAHGVKNERADICALVVTSDGLQLLSAGLTDQTLRAWRLPEVDQMSTKLVNDAVGPMTCAAFNGDGRLAITGHSDGEVLFWDLKKKEVVARHKSHQGAVAGVALSGIGDQALSSGVEDRRLWCYQRGASR